MDIHLIAGDCLENIKLLAKEGILVDAVITDPPYHLKSIAQRFTAGTGFLGHHWDGGDISFRPETWATIASVLKPGGFLLAFGGTRTHHRIWSAIEDAGLVIFDTLSWMYGTGFPKNKALLKPAWEPICVAYKPGGKRVLNIDECRVGTETISVHDAPAGSFAGGEEGRGSDTSSYREHQGRYPSNVIHSGEAEVLETFAEYGEKAGSKGPFLRRKTFDYTSNVNIKSHKEEFAGVGYADEGTAARFFYNTGGAATCGGSWLLRSGG